MMHRLTLSGLIALAWAGGTEAAAPVAEEVTRRAHAYMQARADAGQFSGTVLVARDGKTLFTRGYGFANEERRIPNDAKIRYPIASITKTFTATLVMKLQQQRKLAVADPICRHLADCPDHWRAITVHHLLTHTAGIPDFARTADFPRKVGTHRTRAQLVAEFRDRPLESAPGAKYSYSNSGYVLLGLIAEKAGGKPYAQLLREQLFAPLGMRDTGVGATAGAADVEGYRPDGARKVRAPLVDPSWLFACGDVHSTVVDLLIWDRAIRTGKVLPREQLEAMWSPRHGAYGFGWQLLNSPQSLNRRLVFHAGGLTGFATDFLLYPDDGVTVILLANLLPVPLAEISRELSAIGMGIGTDPQGGR